jgi:hypothetical protein
MSGTQARIRLEQRFALLREIVAGYRIRLQEMEAEVVQLFAGNQLAAISERMEEKQRISILIQRLEQFINRWEAYADFTIDHEKQT